MDGENNGKPVFFKWMILGGKTPYFWKHPNGDFVFTLIKKLVTVVSHIWLFFSTTNIMSDVSDLRVPAFSSFGAQFWHTTFRFFEATGVDSEI